MIIPNKFSVYGDSVALQLAARIAAFSPKFAGYNDYARGGNSLAANLKGDCDGPLFGGLTFADHIQTVDDADIVIIHLGGNDKPAAKDGTLLGPDALPTDYIGADGLPIANDALLHIQYAKSAGKRVVVCGVPYIDPALLMSVMGCSEAQTHGVITKLGIVNQGLRCVAAVGGAAFVAIYGAPVCTGQPVPDATSTVDGVHPSAAYASAVADFLADWIVNHFAL